MEYKSSTRGAIVAGQLPYRLDEVDGMTQVRSLADGLEPLREWFNKNSSHIRLIAIQSPT